MAEAEAGSIDPGVVVLEVVALGEEVSGVVALSFRVVLCRCWLCWVDRVFPVRRCDLGCLVVSSSSCGIGVLQL